MNIIINAMQERNKYNMSSFDYSIILTKSDKENKSQMRKMIQERIDEVNLTWRKLTSSSEGKVNQITFTQILLINNS